MSIQTMKAIRIKAPGEAALDSAPIPQLRDDYILVKTVAVALNPADWKLIDHLAGPGETVGFDYSGVVQQVGRRVQNGLRPGDRVAGMIHGCNASNPQDGAFAEYITAKGDLQIKIPDHMTFEAAATLGSGIITVGQSLFQSLALPLPESAKRDTSILVYGGSTATGSLAIQFAKLSGLRVITTSSPRHEQWLYELGADHVFDYKSPTCAADIRKVTNNQLAYAFDPIATVDSAQICCEAIGPQGGVYTSLEPVSRLPRSDIENKNTMSFTAMGEHFRIGDTDVLAKPEDYEFAVKFTKLVQGLVSQGKVSVHPVSLQRGGLDMVLDGVNKMRAGSVSGVKLVYNIDNPQT